jgi:hypothetical protein
MFWLSGTADRAITYIRSVELNGNREHEFFFRIKILGTAWTEEFSTIMDFEMSL